MSTTDNYRCREAIQRTLAHRAGGTPDASAVADATISTRNQMAARLASVIGARGVDVLFRRSLHVTSTAFPWLAMPGDHGDSDALLAGLKARLAGRETDAAIEASCTLLVNFTELLATLIGESLTDRLLGPVWIPLSPACEKENAS